MNNANTIEWPALLPDKIHRLVVPISRVLDQVSAYRFGKSVLAIWERR
jgi:hypothetical protein